MLTGDRGSFDLRQLCETPNPAPADGSFGLTVWACRPATGADPEVARSLSIAGLAVPSSTDPVPYLDPALTLDVARAREYLGEARHSKGLLRMHAAARQQDRRSSSATSKESKTP